MKKTMNLRKKIVIKKINLLIFSFVLVFIIIILLFKIINERINPILFDYATLESRKFASIIINKAIEKNVATDLVIEDLYIVSKKENNEIKLLIKNPKDKIFDLALRKWVTKAIVIENGQETVHETGHKAEDDPEEVVKVDLKKSKLDKVVVKFEYQIRVTNEGKIAGSVEEISDYIPEGLKFVAADNPEWEEVEGKVVTDQLAGQIMQPGESKEVTILLTWINREDNMGLKVNVAEISKDYNQYETPDIDSTPNNKVEGEDDIDDAPVMLSISTGQMRIYFTLGFIVLVTVAGGVVLIRKYVL